MKGEGGLSLKEKVAGFTVKTKLLSYMNGVLKEGHGQLVLLQKNLEGIVDLSGQVLSEVLQGLLTNDSGVSEPLAVGGNTTGLDRLALEGSGLDDLALSVADGTASLQELDLLSGLCVSVEVLSLDLDITKTVGATGSGDSVVFLL